MVQIGQEEYYPQVFDILGRCDVMLNQLSQDSMLPLEWDTPADIAPLLKAFGVRLDSAEEPVDRLLDYVHLAQEFLHIHFLVVVGVRNYLADEECDAVCHELASADMAVLFVDHDSRPLMKHEKRLIIDADHCELLFP